MFFSLRILQQFPFQIEHIKGSNNSVADALTRSEVTDKNLKVNINYLQLIPDNKWVLNAINASDRSDWPDKIREYLERDRWDQNLDAEFLKFLKGQEKNFELKGQKLYFTEDKRQKLFL